MHICTSVIKSRKHESVYRLVYKPVTYPGSNQVIFESNESADSVSSIGHIEAIMKLNTLSEASNISEPSDDLPGISYVQCITTI